jgi:hypothetical protein
MSGGRDRVPNISICNLTFQDPGRPTLPDVSFGCNLQIAFRGSMVTLIKVWTFSKSQGAIWEHNRVWARSRLRKFVATFALATALSSKERSGCRAHVSTSIVLQAATARSATAGRQPSLAGRCLGFPGMWGWIKARCGFSWIPGINFNGPTYQSRFAHQRSRYAASQDMQLYRASTYISPYLPSSGCNARCPDQHRTQCRC